MARDLAQAIYDIAAAAQRQTLYLVVTKEPRVDLLKIEVLRTHLIITEYGGEVYDGGENYHLAPIWRRYFHDFEDMNVHGVRVMRSAFRIAAYVDLWIKNYVSAHGVKSWAGAKLALYTNKSCTMARHMSPGEVQQCLALKRSVHDGVAAADPFREVQVPAGVHAGDSFKTLFEQMLTATYSYHQSGQLTNVQLGEGWPYND